MSALAQQLILRDDSVWPLPMDLHTLITGNSGTGKSGALLLKSRVTLCDRSRAGVLIDPEGETSDHLLEFAANPLNGVDDRIVRVFRAASDNEAFGLGLLDVACPTPQSAHDAAVRALAVFENILDFGTPEYGPRLSKLFLLAAFALALSGRPLIAMPEVYATADDLRSSIGTAFPYQFMSEEWRALDILAERNPRSFVDYCDSIKSRLIPIFGSPRLRRIFGRAPGRNIDFATMINRCEVALVDLGGLEHKDAVLVGTAAYSLVHHGLMQRPLDAITPVDITLDEAADFLTPDVARGFDRLRKRGGYLTVVCQHLTHFQKRDDPQSATLASVLTNTRCKLLFGGLVPDDAELMAKMAFADALDLDTIWKERSRRPVVVDNETVTLRGRSQAQHHACTAAEASTRSRSSARTRSVNRATASSRALAFGIATNTSHTALPDAGFVTPPTPLSNARADGYSRTFSWTTARQRALADARQTLSGYAIQSSSATMHGSSVTASEAQSVIAKFADLETESYSLDEKTSAVIGLLMALPPRMCVVKIQGRPPALTRTPDLGDNFRTTQMRHLALPIYRAHVRETNPYLEPAAAIDAEIATTMTQLMAPAYEPTHEFASPEPLPADLTTRSSARSRCQPGDKRRRRNKLR